MSDTLIVQSNSADVVHVESVGQISNPTVVVVGPTGSTGTQGPAGPTGPSSTWGGYDESTRFSTSSAVLEDITGATISFTTPSPGRILAIMTVQTTVGAAAAAVGAWAVSINGVDGGELAQSIGGLASIESVAVQAYSELLPAGTYTVKGRVRRVSGSAGVITETAQLSCHLVEVAP